MSLSMGLWVFVCLLCINCVCGATVSTISVGTIVVNGQNCIAMTDKDFICATLDWYPPEKCDYGHCSWGKSSLLNLDLKNVILLNAVKALSHLKIRLGGSLTDRLTYQEDQFQSCDPFTVNSSALFGFNDGCLPLARWDQLNSFFSKTGALVIFALNALNGKVILPNNTAQGPWDLTNAGSLIRYTVKKGYNIYGWELGNELSGKGIEVGIDADTYASDTIALHKLVQKVYEGTNSKPKILAPGGFLEPKWFKDFISKSKGLLDAVTQHIYNLGPGNDEHLVEKILDPSILDSADCLFKDLRDIINISGKKVDAWVGEAGGVHHSGRNGVSNTFLFSFWYLDQLGMASKYGTKTYCRQSLVGGYYGLLDTNTFVPNPDYYSALLWHRLMGQKVLLTKFGGTGMIRAYTHCAKQSKGVTLLLINIDGKTTIEANVSFDGPKENLCGTREEYHLTPMDGNIRSRVVLLNEKMLMVNPRTGTIPVLQPTLVNSSQPIIVAPYSIAFIHMPSVAIPACT